MVMMTWLADVLRAAGLAVEELDGWKTRGRGEMGTVRGILCHHTGGPMQGDRPSLKLVVSGRQDLPGPLSQLFLTRAGVFVVIAAGRCNHAGAGEWQGVNTGNSSFIGCEAENAGTTADPWPEHQILAYAAGAAAVLKHLGASAIMAAGHREYAQPRGRKIDPLFDMDVFRRHVAALMAAGTPAAPATLPGTVKPIAAEPLMLQRGAQGGSVKLLQTLLHVHVDGDFSQETDAAVRDFQSTHGLDPDGRVGPKTWRLLGV